MKTDRAQAIRQFLYTNGLSPVTDIAAAVGVSLPTLRRDLAALEAQGIVRREHGGARLAEEARGEVAFERRESVCLHAKRAIGAAAYALLAPGSAVFLDSSTTVLQLARAIRMAPMELNLFTNCLPVAALLMDAPGVRVTLLGGALRPANASVVGPLAEEMLGGLWFDQLFLGAGAIDDAGLISSADESEARLNARMIDRAERRVLLADASKFGQRLTYRVTALSRLSCIVTDAGMARARAADLVASGHDLLLA